MAYGAPFGGSERYVRSVVPLARGRRRRNVGQRRHTRVNSGSCGPQATWDRASQGVLRLATVLAPGQRRLAPRPVNTLWGTD
eukprot:582903-Prymnesium_polylepis.1